MATRFIKNSWPRLDYRWLGIPPCEWYHYCGMISQRVVVLIYQSINDGKNWKLMAATLKSRSKLRSPCWVTHSRPHWLRSFWSAPRIAISGRTQFSEHAQSFRFVFSAKQIWICQVWRKARESRTSGVRPAQRSRFLVLTKTSAVSGDENRDCLDKNFFITRWT